MAQEGVLHVESQGRAGALAAAMSPGVLRVRPQLQVASKRGHRQGESFWPKRTQIHHPLRCYKGRDHRGHFPSVLLQGRRVNSRASHAVLSLWSWVPVAARVSLRQEESELGDCHLAPPILRLRLNRCTDMGEGLTVSGSPRQAKGAGHGTHGAQEEPAAQPHSRGWWTGRARV